ncbi:MAG: shikimate dehydrogenase [Methanomassiliicoccales archaeon]
MSKICVSVMEQDLKAAAQAVQAAKEGGADLVEIRFDAMPSLPQDLACLKRIDIPKIATLRLASHGGRFEGGEEERLRFFRKCLRSGFDLLDAELGSQLMKHRYRELKRASMICSYHDFSGTPPPSSIVEKLVLASSKEALPKAAFMIRGARDLLSLARAAKMYSATGKQFVLIGMGEMGELTRIRADRLGCAFTYASLCKGKETAPGQIDLATMRSFSKDSIVLGIVGHPLGHTLSPTMHQAALRAAGISGKYLRFDLPPEELEDFIDVVLEYEIKGFNVTIPYKESIIPLLDQADSSAEVVGAVNTVVVRGGRLIGHNTDVYGIESTFKEKSIEPRSKRALVIGAGGAARAACSFLTSAGAEVWIYNRTQARAEALAKAFQGCAALGEDSLRKTEFDIIINCTPVGMEGFPKQLPLPIETLRPGQFVMDTIYNPPETELLRFAKQRGAITANGESMLVHQAARSFALWTDAQVGVEVMLSAIREARA